jgi:hypothetical protein
VILAKEDVDLPLEHVFIAIFEDDMSLSVTATSR